MLSEMTANPQYWLLPGSVVLVDQASLLPQESQPQGPYTQSDIQQMLANGTVLPSDLVCLADGMFHWMEAYHLLHAYQQPAMDLYYGEFPVAYGSLPQAPVYPYPAAVSPYPGVAATAANPPPEVKQASSSSGNKMALILTAVFVVLMIVGISYLSSINDVEPVATIQVDKELEDLLGSPKKISRQSISFHVSHGDVKVIPLPAGTLTVKIESPEGCKYMISTSSVMAGQVDPYKLISLRGSRSRPISLKSTDRYLIITSGARPSSSGKVTLQ